MNLTLHETRVIGCLIEKEITTPDQYPLSPNALTNACNQKSNREPVLSLDESQVRDVVDGLIKKRLLREESGFGSRVTKLQHRFCNTEFGGLKLTEQELGIICVLFLRGPQTPGELRSRTNRLCSFSDVQQVDAVLTQLAEHEDGPFVVKLPREAGKRESRFAHLFSGEVDVNEITAAPASSQTSRVEVLELDVAELKQQVAELQAILSELTD